MEEAAAEELLLLLDAATLLLLDTATLLLDEDALEELEELLKS